MSAAGQLGMGRARKPRPRIQKPPHKLTGRKPKPKPERAASAAKRAEAEPAGAPVAAAGQSPSPMRSFEVETPAEVAAPERAAGEPATNPAPKAVDRSALQTTAQSPGAAPPPMPPPPMPEPGDGEQADQDPVADSSQGMPPPLSWSSRPEVPTFPAPTGTPDLMEDQAPPSQRGHVPISVAPTGEPYSAPPGVPYSVAPPYSLPPGSIAPQGAVALPAKWLTGVAVVVAITALASFALGLLVASGGLQISAKGKPEQPAAQPQPPAPTPQLTAAPQPTAQPAPAPPAPTAAPAASAAEGDEDLDESADDGRDGSELPRNRGYLVVNSSQEDAAVYVYGSRVGNVGEKLEVECGARRLGRLGTYPLTTWLGKGRPMAVTCQGVTTVNMEASPAGASRGGQAPGPMMSEPPADWVPSDL